MCPLNNHQGSDWFSSAKIMDHPHTDSIVWFHYKYLPVPVYRISSELKNQTINVDSTNLYLS